MFVFLIQSLLLLAIAFVLGVICGAIARMLFATDNTATVGAARSPVSQQPAEPAPSRPKPAAVVEDVEEASASTANATPAQPTETAPDTAQEPPPAATTEPAEEAAGVHEEEIKPQASETEPAGAADTGAVSTAKGMDAAEPAAASSTEPDDLKRIKGIGPQNERKLNDLGIISFAQIAQWSAADSETWGDRLAFPGRIEREDWIGQAKSLAEAPPAKPKRKRSSGTKTKT